MVVYAVFEGYYNCDNGTPNLSSVWSSEEKAKRYVDTLKEAINDPLYFVYYRETQIDPEGE